MQKVIHSLKKYLFPHAGNDYRPHLLRYETLSFLFLVIIVIELAFLAQVFIVLDRTKFLASVLPGVLANLANDERAGNNLPPLIESELLTKAAQMKAEDMAKNGYFAHTSPDGKTPWYWFKQVGYNYLYAGENLAVNFFESKEVSEAWMNSPTHKANIIKKDFTEIGIGVAEGIYEGRHTVFVAELFGKPIKLIPPETPTPVVASKPAPAKINPNLTPPVKTNPAPEPTTPVENSPVLVASVPEPTPTEIEVLGEEITTSDTLAKSETNSFKSFMERVLSSPRYYLSYLYATLGLILILTIILSIFRRSTLHHSRHIFHGVGLVAVIVALSILNIFLTNMDVKVPLGSDQTANAISALPE